MIKPRPNQLSGFIGVIKFVDDRIGARKPSLPSVLSMSRGNEDLDSQICLPETIFSYLCLMPKSFCDGDVLDEIISQGQVFLSLRQGVLWECSSANRRNG